MKQTIAQNKVGKIKNKNVFLKYNNNLLLKTNKIISKSMIKKHLNILHPIRNHPKRKGYFRKTTKSLF